MPRTSPHVHLIDASVYIFRAYYSLPPLEAPDGTMVTLHNKEGGSQSDLRRTYGMSNEGLAGLQGKPIEGEWKLVGLDILEEKRL